MVDGPVTAPAPSPTVERPEEHAGRRRTLRKMTYSLLGVAALIFLILALEGVFGGGKVVPGIVPTGQSRTAGGCDAVAVVRQELEDVLEWPGTVRSRSEAQPSSRIMARIVELRVDVGTAVKAGEVLAVLDDRDVLARVEQAKAALAAARAQSAQSDADFARVRGLFEKEAATRRDFEAAQARAAAASAQVEQARQALSEAEVMRTESVLRSPFDGVVTGKWAQAGDTAVPGKPIVAVQDPLQLRLEAHVPESCARKAALGMEVRVRIDSADRDLSARIEEISPAADSQSRTFLLKVALPEGNGIRPGMFGRLIQPCGKKTALLIPAAAVVKAGQLEVVRVLEDGKAATRHVRTGKAYGERVEVLSGLREGEKILPQGR